jgi:diguanylate cyclase (GGDEF)-like protein
MTDPRKPVRPEDAMRTVAVPLTQGWLDDPTLSVARDGADGEAAVPTFALVAYAGSALGRVYNLVPGRNLLGRSADAHVPLVDGEVSRLHAQVIVTPGLSGELIVEDLGSTNGTRLNGVRLSGKRSCGPGDRIGLGGHVFKVVALDPLERAFHESLQDMSMRDPLTGLANRRNTLAVLEERFTLGREAGQILSLVAIDVDHFKRVNDTHGHPAGDEVLRGIGRLLGASVSGAEVAGRIGGEEFLLILPGADMAQALAKAEQVRAAAEATSHSIPGAQLVATLSLGVAAFDPRDETAGDLLGRADRALYLAKGEGRNCVRSGVVDA